jgi:RNA polymerase sigma-70 factor (sigma-E family)
MTPDDDFAEFARAAAPRLRRTAYLLCHDWHAAQDYTQTTLAKMFVRWKRISRTEQPDAYSRKVLLRVFLDQQRRRSAGEVVAAELPEPSPAAAATTELRLTLLDALARIPARDRAIVVLRYWEDRSVDSVSEMLGVPVSTVKSQSARTLAKLRLLLGTHREALFGVPD